MVNCSLLNDKTWKFLINHYNSPFTDNGNTIYICNLESLSQERQKRLLSIILDTNLHVRNRLIFSCTQPRGKGVPHTALEYTNMLGAVHVTAKPLREQRGDLGSAAAIYIDTLNPVSYTHLLRAIHVEELVYQITADTGKQSTCNTQKDSRCACL